MCLSIHLIGIKIKPKYKQFRNTDYWKFFEKLIFMLCKHFWKSHLADEVHPSLCSYAKSMLVWASCLDSFCNHRREIDISRGLFFFFSHLPMQRQNSNFYMTNLRWDGSHLPSHLTFCDTQCLSRLTGWKFSDSLESGDQTLSVCSALLLHSSAWPPIA